MTQLSATKERTADKVETTTSQISNEEKMTKSEEWALIEGLVTVYQMQFKEGATAEEISQARDAGGEIVNRFYPLIKKYVTLIKTGEINFANKETKNFVMLFIDDHSLKKALRREKQSSKYRVSIYESFNFVKKTYGSLPEKEIFIDMQVILLGMVRRYKQMGRSFCGYLYNAYRYEVFRHIKRFTKDPMNIPYRRLDVEDLDIFNTPFEDNLEDKFYEDNLGIPDMEWIQGETCSEIFQVLEPIERKLIVKYYLEDWNDRQISESLGIHINTVNQKRRQALARLANELNIDPSDIKRNRKSGKKAIMPVR